MKSKKRIRPFKKVCAAVLAAVLLSGGFGTSGALPEAGCAGFFPEFTETAQAATADGKIVTYDTDTFQDIPYISDTGNVTIYINDPKAFALEKAELTTSVSGVSIEENIVTGASVSASCALVWSDWSNRSVVSGTNYSVWDVSTEVSANNPITLTWEDAAETQYGESLDVKLVVTGLNFSYAGRRPNAKNNKGYYGLKNVNGSTVDFIPRTDMEFMKTDANGRLAFQSYACADEDNTTVLDTVGGLTFGTDIDYHLEFYDSSGDQVSGKYLMYMQDVDVQDNIAYYTALAGNGWVVADGMDIDNTCWWDPDSDYIESIKFPASTTKIYAIDRTDDYDTSLIQYSSKDLRRISSIWSSENQIEAAGDAYVFTYQTLIAAVQAAVRSNSTLTWTGSRCSTTLFRSYSPETGTITLTKSAAADESGDNGQNIDNPDLAGALYAVRQESTTGPIVGFFVTKSNGTGYVASVSVTETTGSVAYTPEGSKTPLYYTAGSSKYMEVNVGQYYVEELISPYGYALDTSTHKIEVEGGENEGAESTETVDYQQVTLTKESLNADGSEDTSDSTAYEYTVVIRGMDYKQEMRYTVNGGTTTSRTASSNGTVAIYDVSLENGQSAVFEIPVGATYRITEKANAKIASYTVTDANADSGGTIVSASGANTASQKGLTTAFETADSGEDVTVKFTNAAKESVTVTLKKNSVDADGETDKYDTNAYTYNIEIGGLYYGDNYSYTDRTGKTTSVTVEDTGTSSATVSLSLLSAEAATLNLPVGATYQITEEANAKIPSYSVTDANTDSGGTIVSASGQAGRSALSLSTAAETAESGEEVTVTFENRSREAITAYGSLSFDANGGEYSDGTDVKTIMYEGNGYGYEGDYYSGYDPDAARNTYYTKDGDNSDTYSVPEREGYTFLGWALTFDADTAYYTADYSQDSNLAEIENMFPELIDAGSGSDTCYYLFVPNTGLSDTYTWYYAGNYFRSKGLGLSVYDDLMQGLGASSDSILTALSTSDSTDDYYCSVTAVRDALWYYTSYNGGEYIFPAGTYYCAYETDSGEVTTANITLTQSGSNNYLSAFTQTLYAVWEPGEGYLSLQKAADNEQNIDDPDMDGALYAVHEEDADGGIAGYFITDKNGTGYAASADSANADSTANLSVSYNGTTYYATGETVLALETGTYYVEELVAPDMYEAKDIGEVTVKTDKTTTAAYENGDGEPVEYLKVCLTKESLTADGSKDISDSTAYTYTVVISGLESGQEIRYTVNGGSTISCAAGTSGRVTISSSSIALQNGQSAVFEIPVGAAYKITESANAKIASYTVTDANADSGGTIVSASGANDNPYTALSAETETADSGEDVTVTFTNTAVEKVQVCLSKQSVDGSGNADPDDTTAYDVYVSFAAAITGETITYESNKNTDNSGSIAVSNRTGSTTVSIQSGETITFSNVPVGAEYYFREESNDRIASYTITNADSNSGTVEGSASGSNEASGLSLTTSIQTAESGEETTVAYTNKLGTANVQLLKVDVDGEPLAGAVFALYDAEDTLLAEGLETGEDGYTEIVEDLAAGDYYFVETDAPDGYAVTSENPIEFTITEDDLGTTVTVTVTDNTLQILPNAGGTGIWVVLLMSVGMACAAVLILRGRRTGIAPV